MRVCPPLPRRLPPRLPRKQGMPPHGAALGAPASPCWQRQGQCSRVCQLHPSCTGAMPLQAAAQGAVRTLPHPACTCRLDADRGTICGPQLRAASAPWVLGMPSVACVRPVCVCNQCAPDGLPGGVGGGREHRVWAKLRAECQKPAAPLQGVAAADASRARAACGQHGRPQVVQRGSSRGAMDGVCVRARTQVAPVLSQAQREGLGQYLRQCSHGSTGMAPEGGIVLPFPQVGKAAMWPRIPMHAGAFWPVGRV